MTDQEQIKVEGYAAGLASPHCIQCPYDGRTRAGKAWWDGFMAGDAERCAAKQSQPVTETVQCEVNFATGEFREVNPGPRHTIRGVHPDPENPTEPAMCRWCDRPAVILNSVCGKPACAFHEDDSSRPNPLPYHVIRAQRDALADALESTLESLRKNQYLLYSIKGGYLLSEGDLKLIIEMIKELELLIKRFDEQRKE